MAKIFHTWFVEKVAPVWADKIMLSDSEATNQTKFTDIANLPVSTPTSTAIWVVQSDINAHEARTDNPHSVTKAQVGLSDVDNTSDADKPISTATQTALDWKQDTLTGLTATPTELNILDGATLSTTELNYVDGVTSNIQTQLDTKSSLTQIQDNTKQDLSLALTPNYDAISGAIVLDSSKNHYHWIANGWGATGMTINSFSIIPQWENVPAGLFISQDGINMYVIWNTLNTVLQYALWTPYNISTASYTRWFSVAAQCTGSAEVSFKTDWTKMYVCNSTAWIYQYNLWTAWDISTATYYWAYSAGLQTWNLRGFFISPDWTKFYTCEDSADDTCYQYSMWTAWDITTASYSGNKKNVNLDDGSSQSIAFSLSWAEMFILWDTGNNITKYNLWTAWDISTAIVNPIKLYVGVEEGSPYWMRFSSTWNDVYIIWAGKIIYQYNLVRPYQLFTDIAYIPNGWLNGWGAYDFDGVNDYIELNDGMMIKSTSIADKETTIGGLFIRADGLMMYTVWETSDNVHQYSLSTAWEITTKVFVQSFSISWQEISSTALSFSTDGKKMYVVGYAWDDISYYTLSTAWDISTATHNGQFAVWNGETWPNAIYIRDDGLKFYIVGTGNDTVYQYSMSPAWDMSTASYDGISLSVTALEATPTWITFYPDGTKMYILWSSGDDITEFTLWTAWNVSTGTETWITFYMWTQDTIPADIQFSSDWTKLYMAGAATDTIYQYNLYSAYSFSNPMYSNGFTIIADINPDISSDWRIIDKTYDNNSAVTGHQAYVSASWAVDYRINAGWVISSGTGKFPLATMKRLVITVSSLGAGIIFLMG